jgi:uncharacterized membrane protein YidH (DUF202 family)
MATPTMTETYRPPERLAPVQTMALLVGIVALAAGALAFMNDREHFFKGYLLGFVFWTGVSLGCLALSMVHHLSGGAWGMVTRRIFEASSRALPFMAVLFVPLAFGLHDLYLWARPEAVQADPALQHKASYLNVGFFLARTAIYFAVWSAMALLLSRWSLMQERGDPNEQLSMRMQRLSGGGLVVYALTAFFMSVDWMMSLDPHWFSTIYGMLFMVNQGLSALAFTIATLVLLSRIEPMSRVVEPAHLHDLGKLMLAFVMLWAYLTFSQFLIVWSANLPEEIPWYLTRMQGGWGYVSAGLVIFHLFVPFLLLLNRDLKRQGPLLVAVACWIIVMRLVDLFWLIGPLHGEGPLRVHWADLAAPVGIGGVWVAVFIRQLRSRALLPLGEPYLKSALEHRHGH